VQEPGLGLYLLGSVTRDEAVEVRPWVPAGKTHALGGFAFGLDSAVPLNDPRPSRVTAAIFTTRHDRRRRRQPPPVLQRRPLAAISSGK